MENNKLIAKLLLEIAERSETTFLEVGAEDKELIEAAKKIGIVLPSPDLMVMKTVYAEIDKVNLNGVSLPRKAVKEGLDTLIGKQCNWEHDGAGFVCGYTISAKINEDKVETINVLFKSLFPEQAEELKNKVKSGEAAVSFEIWNKNPETGKSVVKELNNGFKEISPIIFHGTGVLLSHKPACPKAKIFKLIAIKEIQEAEKIVDKVFEQDIIYAEMATEKSKCKNCGTCTCKEEDNKLEQTEESKEKLCPECKEPMKKDEEICSKCLEKKQKADVVETPAVVAPIETKELVVPATEETKVEAPKVEEVKIEEVAVKKVEQAAQPLEVVEPKVIVKISHIFSEIRIDTFVDGTPNGTQEVKGLNKTITEYKDGTKDEVEEVVEIKKKYDFAELEAAVNQAKEELTNLHKAEIEAKTNEAKIASEQKIAEKETEIANLKQELVAKAQEVAELKTPKVVEAKKEEPVIEVGNTETKVKDSYYKDRQKKINLKAYGHE